MYRKCSISCACTIATGRMSFRGKCRSELYCKPQQGSSYSKNFKPQQGSSCSKKFAVHRKLVQTWCRQESELVTISSSRKRLPGGGMKEKYSDIDELAIARHTFRSIRPLNRVYDIVFHRVFSMALHGALLLENVQLIERLWYLFCLAPQCSP